MSFLTLDFSIFLLITLVLYYVAGLIKHKGKIVIAPYFILLISSLVFFGYSNALYLIYILITVIVTYICSFFMSYKIVKEDKKLHIKENQTPKKGLRVTLLVLGIVFIVGVLFTLKYFNFFAENIFNMFGQPYEKIAFIVPIGISFYSFTLIAYLVDVFKGKYQSELNILKFTLFATYFPKVLQGPITSITKCKEGHLFDVNSFESTDFIKGFKRIAVGLCKKVIIADTLGVYVNYMWNNYSNVNSFYLMLGSILYAIQLYCDFSGYIDMGLGISSWFGVKLEENFDTPYLSKDVGEFWRRWHMTLGSFLKNYIYIPCGGNRCNKFRWMLNILLVWFISGLWHGANWNYIVWGLYFGVLIIFASLIKQALKKKNYAANKWIKGLGVVTTFLLVDLGWIFFRAPDLMSAFDYIRCSFTNFNIETHLFTLVEIPWAFFLVAAIICALLVLMYVYKQKRAYFVTKFANEATLIKIEQITTFIFATLFMSYGVFLNIYYGGLGVAGSSFIYFQF